MAADMRAYKALLVELLEAYNDDSDPPRAPDPQAYQGRASSDATPVPQTIVYIGSVDFADGGFHLGRVPAEYHRWAKMTGSIICVDSMPRWDDCQDRAIRLAAWLTSAYDFVSGDDPDIVIANMTVGEVRELNAMDHFQAGAAFAVGITFSAHLSQYPIDPVPRFPVDPDSQGPVNPDDVVDRISLMWDPDGDGVLEDTQLVP